MSRKTLLIATVSTACMILVWHGAAVVLSEEFILPSPLAVAIDAVHLLASPSFARIIAATCARSLVAFAMSAVLSLVLGISAGYRPAVESAIKPWMALIKATPVVSFIILALLWFGSSFVPVFVSVLMTLPVMTEAILQGMKHTDTKILKMARAYRFSRFTILFHVRFPSVLPFFLGGAGAALGLTWKVVVAGEILGLPRYGIGSAMQTAKTHLETQRVFSLTICAVILSVLTEIVFNHLVALASRHRIRDEAV